MKRSDKDASLLSLLSLAISLPLPLFKPPLPCTMPEPSLPPALPPPAKASDSFALKSPVKAPPPLQHFDDTLHQITIK